MANSLPLNMARSIQESLRSLRLFATLPDPLIESLSTFTTLRKSRAGETIFCQGEPSPYCFGILSGEVMIQRVSKDKRFPSKVLGLLGPGDIFGESSLFEESRRGAQATANKDSELVAIFGSKFREWLASEPAVSVPLVMGLLDRTLNRLHQTSHELSIVYGVGRLLASNQSAPERLAGCMDFMKGSLDGVDTIYCFKRSVYWEEFECLYPTEEAPRLPSIPLAGALAALAQAAGGPLVLETPEHRRALTDLKLPCAEAASVVLVPLLDLDQPDTSLQGFLLMASGEKANLFNRDALLMLSAVANPLAETLSRQRRQEDSSAQARLQQSRGSIHL